MMAVRAMTHSLAGGAPARGLIALVMLAAVGGCERGTDPNLRGRVLHSSDRLGRPGAMAVAGERLVVLDDRAEFAVHLIRRADGALERSLGKRGDGPNEFRGAWRVVADRRDRDRVWVFDFDRSRLVGVPVDPARSGTAGDWPAFQLGAGAPLTSPVWVSDTTVVSPGLFTAEGRLAVMNARGELVRMAGTTPPGLGTVPVPIQVRQHAAQSLATAHPTRGLVALALRHADRVEILRADGTRAAEGRGAEGFEPVYRVASHGGAPVFDGGEELRFGYVNVASTADRIYALYSGRTRKSHAGRATGGDAVHVFDWEGKRLRELKLDGDYGSIAVDPKGRKLYAAREDPEPAIVEFTLP